MTGFRTTLPQTPPRAASGWLGSADVRPGSRDGRVPGGRRRSVPHLVVGALLVVVCAVGFAVAASSVDHRASVLALARPVSVGQRLTSADLRTVRVSAAAGVATVPASMLNQVTGQQVAVSLPAGALLTRAELGTVAVPAGQAIVAVAVKAGQAPPDLVPGDHVLLVVAQSAGPGDSSTSSTESGTPGSAGPWPGVVTGIVAPSATTDSTVVSVQLADSSARVVAALPTGQVDIVLVPGS